MSQQESKETKSQKSYTVMSTSAGKDHEGGRFHGSSPKKAAKKAANKIFHQAGPGLKKLTLKLRETTSGSKKKVRTYEATKKVVDKSFEVEGKTIKVGQEIEIKRVDE